MQFCDNGPTPPVEYRLYIDADHWVEPGGVLMDVMGLTVAEAIVGSGDPELAVRFDNDMVLRVSGLGNDTTTHEVWWLGTVQ